MVLELFKKNLLCADIIIKIDLKFIVTSISF